ncbi:MAG: prepilin peptidase [Patescibacteria group bacterium]
MQYFFLVLIFFIGTALGSFISVIANRYNTGLSFMKGRSVCFSCNTELKNKDLFPIFSFLFLKGKCRYCGSKIPKETFITEILMGVLTVVAFLKFGLFLNFVLVTAIFGVILLISIYDIKHFIIPDSFLISLFVLSLIHNSYFIILNSLPFTSYLLSLASGIVLTIPFLLIFIISKGTWFGFGDVKYILVLGFLLGFSVGLSAIVLSFWIGAVVSLTMLIAKKIAHRINLPLLRNNLTIKSEIPFGPFLSLGIIISFCLNLDLFHVNELFF